MRRLPLAGLLLGAVLAPLSDVPGQKPPPARRGHRGRGTLAIVVGTLHPVSGPAVQDAVILVRGPRIAAIGPKDRVPVPAGAKVLELPRAHAYPGLVDALSTAFADASIRQDRSTDAGSRIADALDPFDRESRHVIEAGVTTAFVGNRGPTTWRGLGAVVRPRPDRFTVMRGKDEAAVLMRVGGADDRTHPLVRQKALRQIGKAFEALKAYEKQQADYRKALEKYEKDFAAYLAWHTEHKGAKRGAEASPAKGRKAGEAGAKGKNKGKGKGKGKGKARRRPPRGKGRPPSAKTPPAPTPKPASAAPGGQASETGAKAKKAKADTPPPRPKRPRKPKKDPAKEALLKVRKGQLPLRVEAHRPDEIRAVLELARRHEIPHVVLEMASRAGAMASAIAEAGIPVVIAGIEPGLDRERRVDGAALAARLSRAGVAVALATGPSTPARHLPLLAALAVGAGMDPDEAVRALTLTPARILGVADRLGSLEPGKVADILITDGPLLSARTRVLRVLAAGRTLFTAKP